MWFSHAGAWCDLVLMSIDGHFDPSGTVFAVPNLALGSEGMRVKAPVSRQCGFA